MTDEARNRRCRRCRRSTPTRPRPGGGTGHAGRGLCELCWQWLSRHGELVDYERLTRSRDDLLDDYVLLRAQGHDWRQCAARLGMSFAAFSRAMHRARADNDPRAGRIGETWPPTARVRAS